MKSGSQCTMLQSTSSSIYYKYIICFTYMCVCVCVSVLGSPLLSVLSSHTIQNLVACPSPYLQQTALSEVNIPKSLLKAVEKGCSY